MTNNKTNKEGRTKGKKKNHWEEWTETDNWKKGGKSFLPWQQDKRLIVSNVNCFIPNFLLSYLMLCYWGVLCIYLRSLAMHGSVGGVAMMKKIKSSGKKNCTV